MNSTFVVGDINIVIPRKKASVVDMDKPCLSPHA
jgi:hypothetical protein